MRFTPFIIVGFLVGCVGAPVPDTTEQDDQEPGQAYSYARPATKGPFGCGTMTQVIGGGDFAVTVPVPCDPFYLDRGDPPPDDIGDDVIDPEPDQGPELPEQLTRPVEF